MEPDRAAISKVAVRPPAQVPKGSHRVVVIHLIRRGYPRWPFQLQGERSAAIDECEKSLRAVAALRRAVLRPRIIIIPVSQKAEHHECPHAPKIRSAANREGSGVKKVDTAP